MSRYIKPYYHYQQQYVLLPPRTKNNNIYSFSTDLYFDFWGFMYTTDFFIIIYRNKSNIIGGGANSFLFPAATSRDACLSDLLLQSSYLLLGRPLLVLSPRHGHVVLGEQDVRSDAEDAPAGIELKPQQVESWNRNNWRAETATSGELKPQHVESWNRNMWRAETATSEELKPQQVKSWNRNMWRAETATCGELKPQQVESWNRNKLGELKPQQVKRLIANK